MTGSIATSARGTADPDRLPPGAFALSADGRRELIAWGRYADSYEKRGGVWRGLASGGANFIRVYLFQRGFLCGRAGFLHSYFVGLECFFRYVALEVDRDRLTEPARRT